MIANTLLKEKKFRNQNFSLQMRTTNKAQYTQSQSMKIKCFLIRLFIKFHIRITLVSMRIFKINNCIKELNLKSSIQISETTIRINLLLSSSHLVRKRSLRVETNKMFIQQILRLIIILSL